MCHVLLWLFKIGMFNKLLIILLLVSSSLASFMIFMIVDIIFSLSVSISPTRAFSPASYLL